MSCGCTQSTTVNKQQQKRIPLNCLHIGERQPVPEGENPSKEFFECEVGKGVVCKCNCSQKKCDRYTVDLQRPDLIAVGVVIASNNQPLLIELQIRLLRSTVGDIPILVADSPSASSDTIKALCTQHNVEFFVTTGGDAAVGVAGWKWATEKGLKVLCKLDQHIGVTKKDWLQTESERLLSSGKAMTTKGCSDQPTMPTDALLLNVDMWTEETIKEQMSSRIPIDSVEFLRTATPQRISRRAAKFGIKI